MAEFPATGDIGELAEGITAEQIYTSQMDFIDAVGVMVSDYGKHLTGGLHVRVEDATDGHLIRTKLLEIGGYSALTYDNSIFCRGIPVRKGEAELVFYHIMCSEEI